MNKFLVKIDRNSFRANPEAGKTATQVVGRWNGSVEVKGTIWVPEHLEDGYMLRSSENGKHNYVCACAPSMERLLHALKVAGANMERDVAYTVNQDVQTLYHAPNPPWCFRYLETEVQCSECKAKFPHTHLQSMCESDEFGHAESDEVCPHCGAIDCCEVEFEQPQAVADELFIV